MEDQKRTPITVDTTVDIPVERAWKYWTEPEHIKQWTFASNDWHSPYADNDVKVGGTFKTTMAAKDGSFSFDFEGVYTDVEELKLMKYELGDGRKVSVEFIDLGGSARIIEAFDPEAENPLEMQKGGWQAILDNYKKYAESQG